MVRASAPCNASVEIQLSRTPCVLGENYGCIGTSVWVASPCRAKLRCEAGQVRLAATMAHHDTYHTVSPLHRR